MRLSLSLGLVILGGGLFKIYERGQSLGWFATGYVVAGLVLLAIGLFLLHRGPKLPDDEADDHAETEQV